MEILECEGLIEALKPEYVTVVFSNNKRVKMHSRDMLVHGILWKNLLHFGVEIDKSQVYEVYPVAGNMISKCLTTQYTTLLEKCESVPHTDIIYKLWESIHEIYRFYYVNLGAYVCTTDILDMIDVVFAPELTHLTLKDLPTNMGTGEAERVFAKRSKELNNTLTEIGAMEYNPIINFMQTGVFKGNQIPQLVMALCTRDDIDGKMLPHIMNCSAMSGMKTLADLGTEAAAPKKTTFYNTSIIKETQSFYRSMRLLTCNLNITYKGDCGNRNMINHLIEKGYGHNYIDKVVKYKGKMVAITRDNFHKFEGEYVLLISPIACRHTDGVCEHCAGRATTNPWAYLPDVRIGVYAASVIFSDISQKVLSAKHLIKTFTVILEMSQTAAKYLATDAKSNLKLNRSMLKNLKDWSILVETEFVGHPNDLRYSSITPMGFGKFKRIGFKNRNTDKIVAFPITTNDMTHHFSTDMLEHMRDVVDEISMVEKFYEIPLDGYNSRRAIINVVAKNDDIVAYSKRIRTMFKSGISEYPNIELALACIAGEIHSKVDANIFFIELIIKAIMNSVLPDDGKINIGTMKSVIASNNVAAKLGHEEVKRYLFSPEVSVSAKQPSPFDMLFNFG